MRYAEWLVWAKIALSVIGGIVVVLLLDTIVHDVMTRTDFHGAPPDTSTVRALVLVAAGLSVVVSVVVMGGLALFLHRGANWARITYTVLVGLGLLFSIQSLVRGSSGSAPLPLAIDVIGLPLSVAVLVFLWRRESTAWFTHR